MLQVYKNRLKLNKIVNTVIDVGINPFLLVASCYKLSIIVNKL